MLLGEASSPEPILATGPALARRLQPHAGAGAAGQSGSEVPLKGEAPLSHPLQHSATAPIPTAVLLPGHAALQPPGHPTGPCCSEMRQMRHQQTWGCSLNSPLSPATAPLPPCHAGPVEKQSAQHFHSLFYKNKPVLPWYSMAPNLPLHPCFCSSARSSHCSRRSSHGGCPCPRSRGVPKQAPVKGLVPFCECSSSQDPSWKLPEDASWWPCRFCTGNKSWTKSLRVHTRCEKGRLSVCLSLSRWKSEPHEVASWPLSAGSAGS